jgi:LemA protein
MALVIVIAVLLVLVFVGVSAYNKLISLRAQVENAWKQIDVQLKRRHDLIPNLVNTVRSAMGFERETLEAVVEARNKALAVESSTGGKVSHSGIAATAAAETHLTGALSRLLAVVEAYPDLKATGNVAQLQEELSSTENKIAFARQLYNDTATQYNAAQRMFPTVLFAGIAGASQVPLWEISNEEERATPNVDLGFNPTS